MSYPVELGPSIVPNDYEFARRALLCHTSTEYDVESISASTSNSHSATVDWQKLCQELIVERNQLRVELAETQEERDQYKKAVLESYREQDFDFDKEELVSHSWVKQPIAGEHDCRTWKVDGALNG